MTERNDRFPPSLIPLLVDVASLQADPANARRHPERNLDAIRASLRRFGQQKPIVVDASGVVIAGSGTLEAARLEGWPEIAAVRSALLGPDRTAFGIADNRTAELAVWDEDALGALLASFDEDLDALGATGFSEKEIAELTRIEPKGDPEKIPEPPAVARAQRGDLILLGAHRLLCGDSTNATDVRRLMDGERAVLFATDPPYLVGYDGTNHPGTKASRRRASLNTDWSDTYGTAWDEADAEQNNDLYHRFIRTAVEVAVLPNAAWYCWHASRRQRMVEEAWEKSGAFVHQQIIWAKERAVLTRSWYLWQHEPCFFGWIKGQKPPRVADAPPQATVWTLPSISRDEDLDHPTPKPVDCFAIPMLQHTEPGDLCYEPFSGSGTQIIAAERTGRRCFGMEIEPRYVDVIVQRWQEFTGKKAEGWRGNDEPPAEPEESPGAN